jgi:hypothetical protein
VREIFLAAARATNSSTHATAKAAASLDPRLWEFLWRGLRVVAVVFAIASICSLLVGAFRYMVVSGNDENVMKCRRRIIVGGTGAAVMIFLYYFASLMLIKMGQ